ncbi:MAG: glycoside hydrolase family 95 protein, partial [Burkholderiales bacterium]
MGPRSQPFRPAARRHHDQKDNGLYRSSTCINNHADGAARHAAARTPRQKWPLFAALAALFFLSPAWSSELSLVYNQPATQWTEALPLGNGLMGAMVFGGMPDERVQLNLGTLWGGAPHDNNNPDAGTKLKQIQQLIFSGKVLQAESLGAGFMGDPKVLAPFQPFADLHLHFEGHDKASHYRRALDLNDAIATVSYTVDGTHYHRETFVSYPDRVMVMRLTADRPGKQNFTLSITSPQPGAHVALAGKNGIALSGQIQPRSNPESSWTASWSGPGMK